MTSVNYLIKEISAVLGAIKTEPMQDLLLVDAINKAKEMHRKEIIDAFKSGDYGNIRNAVIYYNETYGSKESDDVATQTT